MPHASTSIKRLTEQTTITKVVGGYVEQVFGLDDRFFVTGSLRFDKNSSTGIEAKTILYPKAAASWLTPWFEAGTLSSLRLRASYGEAGQQPGGPVALETYTATQAAIAGVVTPAVVLGNFGDVQLKAERSREFEGGFDLGVAFVGESAVDVESWGGTLSGNAQFRAELAREEAEWEERLDDADLYPVLNLGLRVGVGN